MIARSRGLRAVGWVAVVVMAALALVTALALALQGHASAAPAGRGVTHHTSTGQGVHTSPSPTGQGVGLVVPRDPCTTPGVRGTGRGDGEPYVCVERAGDGCPRWHRVIVPGEPRGLWSSRPAKPCPVCSASPSTPASVPATTPPVASPSTTVVVPVAASTSTAAGELPVTGDATARWVWVAVALLTVGGLLTWYGYRARRREAKRQH